MLFNKNNVRKANDKKVLHKVHKNWIVVSTALLLAIGGGAVAAHTTTANADNTGATNVSAEDNTSYNLKPASDGTGGTPVNATQQSASASKVPLNDNLIMENNAIKSLAAQGENADQIVDNVQPSVASYNANAHFDLFGLNGHNASLGSNYSANNNLVPNNNNNNNNNTSASVAAPTADATNMISAFTNGNNAWNVNNGQSVYNNATPAPAGPMVGNVSYVDSAIGFFNSDINAFHNTMSAAENVVGTDSAIMTSASDAAARAAYITHNTSVYNSAEAVLLSASNENSGASSVFSNASGSASSEFFNDDIKIESGSDSTSQKNASFAGSSAANSVEVMYNTNMSNDDVDNDDGAKLNDYSAMSSEFTSDANRVANEVSAFSNDASEDSSELASLYSKDSAAANDSNAAVKASIATQESEVLNDMLSASTEFITTSNEGSAISSVASVASDSAYNADSAGGTPVISSVDTSALSSIGKSASVLAASLSTTNSLSNNAASALSMVVTSGNNTTPENNWINIGGFRDLTTGSSSVESGTISAVSFASISNDSSAVASVENSLDTQLSAEAISMSGVGAGTEQTYIIAPDAHNAAVFAGMGLNEKNPAASTPNSNITLDILPKYASLTKGNYVNIDDQGDHTPTNKLVAYNTVTGAILGKNSVDAGADNNVTNYINEVPVDKNGVAHVLTTQDATGANNFAAVHLVNAGNPNDVMFTGIVGAYNGNNQTTVGANPMVAHGDDTTTYMVESILAQNGEPMGKFSAQGQFNEDPDSSDNFGYAKEKFISNTAAISVLKNNDGDEIITIPIVQNY